MPSTRCGSSGCERQRKTTQQSKGEDSQTFRVDLKALVRYIDRQYELQGYRIPLPESEELCVPEPEGVDLGKMPEEYLTEEAQSEEAAHRYSRDQAGVKPEKEERTPSPARFEEITD